MWTICFRKTKQKGEKRILKSYNIMLGLLNKDYINIFKKHLIAIEKQEVWRQKQLDIFYRKGRPLFKKYNDY